MPVFNEGQALSRYVPEVLQALRQFGVPVEIILVNDGSKDQSGAVMAQLSAAHPEVLSLDLSRNFGKEAALCAGLDAAQGDAVLVMDSDGQHPLDVVPRMWAQLEAGAEVAYAVRRQRLDQSHLQRRLTRWFYALVNWGNSTEIPEDAGDFRMMRRSVVEALRALPERNRFMKGLYAWVGFRSVALDYDPLPRLHGQSSFGLQGSLRLGLTGLFAFSLAPLRVVALLGAALAMVSLAYGLFVIAEYWLWGITVPGYATIVVALMFFNGVQLIAMGLLAEYLARVYEEVKRRPLYWVRERHGQGLGVPPSAAS